MTLPNGTIRNTKGEYISVDPVAFCREFAKRNLSLAQVSLGMGCGENYLNKRVHEIGTVPQFVLNYLRDKYAIEEESVTCGPKKPEKTWQRGKKNDIQIDDLKLRQALADRGFTLSDVSVAMGFAQNYLSLCASTRGSISDYGAYTLEKLTGISPDMYRKSAAPALVKKEAKPAVQPEPGKTLTAYDLDTFAQRLSELIEKAAYNGVMKALKH